MTNIFFLRWGFFCKFAHYVSGWWAMHPSYLLGLCVKMNASCKINLTNRYSDQLNLRTDLILTKQDYSRRQRLLV